MGGNCFVFLRRARIEKYQTMSRATAVANPTAPAHIQIANCWLLVEVSKPAGSVIFKLLAV